MYRRFILLYITTKIIIASKKIRLTCNFFIEINVKVNKLKNKQDEKTIANSSG